MNRDDRLAERVKWIQDSFEEFFERLESARASDPEPKTVYLFGAKNQIVKALNAMKQIAKKGKKDA